MCACKYVYYLCETEDGKGYLGRRKKSGENKPEVMGKRVEQLRLDWMKEGKKLGEAEEEIR